MTVTSSINKVKFIGDGLNNNFATDFPFFDSSSLRVVLVENEVETNLDEGIHYTVTGGGGAEGTVVYPKSGDPLAPTQQLVIVREEPFEQKFQQSVNGTLQAEGMNTAFDKAVMRDQQLQEQVNRAIKYDISTPEEEQLSPQELVATISSARDASVSAQSSAETARDQAQSAQSAAETARTGAEAAQVAAEAARDEAAGVAIGDLDSYRTPLPELSGPSDGSEGTTVYIALTNYVEGYSYYPSVSAGTVGSVTVIPDGHPGAGLHGFAWQLPTVTVDTSHTFSVVAEKDDLLKSRAVACNLTVKDVPVNGVAVSIADSEWNKTPDASGIEPPAHSNPADNANQVLSAELEIELASAELENLFNVSASGFETTTPLEVGVVVVADTGSSSVASVSGGGATTVETSQAGGSNSFGATFMNNNYPLPNGEKIKALGLKSSSAQTGFLFVYRQDSATEYTCVARVVLTHSGSNLFEYADLDTPFNVPSTGTFYIAGSSFDTAGAYMYDTSALRANPVDAAVGETLTFAATTIAPVTGYQYEGEYTVTVNPPFPTAPTKIFKKPAGLALKLGAGIVGEYLGPEIPLAWGTGSNTSDLVFESSESLAEKVVKPNGPPVGGTGAELIPSFVGAIYDEETQTSTVDGWSMSQNAVINQNYPFCKTRQNDEATTVPGYLPSWATGSASGYGFVTAPQPVVIGALILGGGIPGGLSASPPENILLEGFNGTSWDVLVDTTETRWTSDWQEFEYPVSNAAAYTEFRLAMDRDKVLHKIQFKEASNLAYTADPNARHNDIEIEGVRHKVSQVVEDGNKIAVTLSTPLTQAPTGAEVVKIPDRCTLTPAALSAQIVSGKLKITSDMISLVDDPNIKRLVMAVFGPADMRFKSATMNIQERS